MGAVGLLVALVVMAGMAAIVLGVSHNSGGGHSVGSASLGTLSAAPSAAEGDIAAAARATCRADFDAVQQAADAYTAEDGHPPASMADPSGMLRDPVTSTHFTISVGAGGRIEVATTGHAAAPGSGNCSYAG